jgi:hypothetical protein
VERSFIADLSRRGRRTLGLVNRTTGDIKWAFDRAAGRAARAKKQIVFTQATGAHFQAHARSWKRKYARTLWRAQPAHPLRLSGQRHLGLDEIGVERIAAIMRAASDAGAPEVDAG